MNTFESVGSLPRRKGGWAWVVGLGTVLVAASCSDAVIPLVTTWEGSLEPTTPAGPRGALGVISQDGRANTSLQLTQGQGGSTYAWRIQAGTCADGGETVGGVAAYPQLTPGEDGSAQGHTTLSRELNPDGAYAGWIYLVSGGGQAPVACGELLRTR